MQEYESNKKKDARSFLFTEERRTAILTMVRQQEKVTVSDLVHHFAVSGATIRADLRELETAHLLVRTHGGAMDSIKSRHEFGFNQRKIQHREAKRAIAKEAVKLIEDGDTILLDTGTTTYELATRLAGRSNLTVVTNDLEIARLLEDISTVTLLFIGGLVRRGFHCTRNIRVPMAVGDLTVDKTFLGTNGFSLDKGATTPDIIHAEDKRQMIAMARHVILLCDSSKIEKVFFVRFAEPGQINTLVTDTLDADLKKRLEDAGMTVIIPSSPSLSRIAGSD